MNYTKIEKENYMKRYQHGNLNVEEFCRCNSIKEELFIKWLNSYIKDYVFAPINESMDNNYILYKENKYLDSGNEVIPVCKINLVDCLFNVPIAETEEYEKIGFDIMNNNIMILKLKFINLDYYSTGGDEIFKNIFISDKNMRLIANLKNSGFEYTKYAEEIKYNNAYDKRYLPKIVYNVMLVFEISKEEMEYTIAFKNFKVEGTGIKRINIEKSKKIKNKIDPKIKCPNCESFDIIKVGYKNGKQRYQCKECKRKFQGEKIVM